MLAVPLVGVCVCCLSAVRDFARMVKFFWISSEDVTISEAVRMFHALVAWWFTEANRWPSFLSVSNPKRRSVTQWQTPSYCRETPNPKSVVFRFSTDNCLVLSQTSYNNISIFFLSPHTEPVAKDMREVLACILSVGSNLLLWGSHLLMPSFLITRG